MNSKIFKFTLGLALILYGYTGTVQLGAAEAQNPNLLSVSKTADNPIHSLTSSTVSPLNQNFDMAILSMSAPIDDLVVWDLADRAQPVDDSVFQHDRDRDLRDDSCGIGNACDNCGNSCGDNCSNSEDYDYDDDDVCVARPVSCCCQRSGYGYGGGGAGGGGGGGGGFIGGGFGGGGGGGVGGGGHGDNHHEKTPPTPPPPPEVPVPEPTTWLIMGSLVTMSISLKLYKTKQTEK